MERKRPWDSQAGLSLTGSQAAWPQWASVYPSGKWAEHSSSHHHDAPVCGFGGLCLCLQPPLKPPDGISVTFTCLAVTSEVLRGQHQAPSGPSVLAPAGPATWSALPGCIRAPERT